MACVSPISSTDLKRILASRAFSRVGEPKRNRAIFAMQLCLGPRIHELLALRCGDVLYSTGALRPTIYFRKTKTAVPRRIEANNPLLIRYLQPWIFRLDQLGILHANTWLFPGRSWDKPLTRQQVYAIYRPHTGNSALSGSAPIRRARRGPSPLTTTGSASSAPGGRSIPL